MVVDAIGLRVGEMVVNDGFVKMETRSRGSLAVYRRQSFTNSQTPLLRTVGINDRPLLALVTNKLLCIQTAT